MATGRNDRGHSYLTPGTYTVMLSVTEISGRRAPVPRNVDAAPRALSWKKPDRHGLARDLGAVKLAMKWLARAPSSELSNQHTVSGGIR